MPLTKNNSFAIVAIIAALAPLSAHAQTVVTGEVHWDQSQGRSVPGGAYGANVWQGFDPNIAGDDGASNHGNATYKSRVADLRFGLIRYHSYEMVQDSSTQRGWATNLVSGTPGWDKTKIQNAMRGAYPWGPQVMINIPIWPDRWKTAGTNRLDPSHYQDFANWCAALVRTVNGSTAQGGLAKGIVYWEVMNEPDLNGYSGQSDFQQVGQIFAACATAMKAVDSTIKVGGPAFASAYKEQASNLNGFFDTAGSNLAFVSYHGYGTFDKNSSTTGLYDVARDIWGESYWAAVAMNQHGLNNLERFHDELNVNSAQTGSNLDPRQWNEKGLIFNTLALLTLATSGYTTGNMCGMSAITGMA